MGQAGTCPVANGGSGLLVEVSLGLLCVLGIAFGCKLLGVVCCLRSNLLFIRAKQALRAIAF